MTAHNIGESILLAWNGHHKRTSFESRDAVVQVLMGMSDKIDWEDFTVNGILYRRYWDQKGWQYCTETLLGWVRNGCKAPPAPRSAVGPTRPVVSLGFEEYRQMLVDGGELAEEADRLARIEYKR